MLAWQCSPTASGQAAPIASQAAPDVSGAPLTLTAATTAALAQSPTYRAASFQLAQQQAKINQAQALRLFQVTFTSTASGSNADVIQPPPSHETFYTITNSINVPLPVGTRLRFAIEQAREQYAAAEAQYASARLTLIGQVNAAYYDVLRRQALLMVAQQTLEQAQLQLTAAQRRFRAGDVPELDVFRAQLPVASAQAAVAQADTTLIVAQQTLNDLLGRPLEAPAPLAAAPPLPSTLPSTLPAVRALALRRSPEIRSAEATVRASEVAVKSTRRWNEPLLALQASDTRSSDQTGFSRVDSIGVTVSIPLSDGGLGRAQTREAQATLQQARAQVEVARRTVLTRVSSAYLTAQSSLQQIEAAGVVRDIAQISYDKTVQGYQNGLFPFSDVLLSQNALSQARTAYTQATYDAAVALATLENATGGSNP